VDRMGSGSTLSKVTDRDRTATASAVAVMTAVMTALFDDRN
jgi:hypothetical protein